MKSLERKFEKIVVKLRKRYSFLEGVTFDICEGYGIVGATGYQPPSSSIYVDLVALRKVYNTPRFNRRLGRHKTFEDFVLAVLLHEIVHARQHQTIPEHLFQSALNEISPFDAGSHDESWVEKEADKWARQELRKWKRSSRTATV